MRSDLVAMSPKELRRREAMHRLEAGATLAEVARSPRLEPTPGQAAQTCLPGPWRKETPLRQTRPPGKRRLAAGVLKAATDLVRAHYADFGPTLACEKLAERHQVRVNRETLRQRMIEAGIWRAKPRRHAYHPPRERRPRFGELIQIDGSPHAWFEDRSQMHALVFLDDATSKLVGLRFTQQETTAACFAIAKSSFEKYGLPEAFCSDRFSVFRINRSNTGPIDAIAAANAMLPSYLERPNERFSIAPRDAFDAHRTLSTDADLGREWHISCDCHAGAEPAKALATPLGQGGFAQRREAVADLGRLVLLRLEAGSLDRLLLVHLFSSACRAGTAPRGYRSA